MDTTPNIRVITTDLWTEILRYLSRSDLCNLECVSKFFRSSKALRAAWFGWCVRDFSRNTQIIQLAERSKHQGFDSEDERNWKRIYYMWKNEKKRKNGLCFDRLRELNIAVCEDVDIDDNLMDLETEPETFAHIKLLLRDIREAGYNLDRTFSDWFMKFDQSQFDEVSNTLDPLLYQHDKCFDLVREFHQQFQQMQQRVPDARFRMYRNMLDFCIHRLKTAKEQLNFQLQRYRNRIYERCIRTMKIVSPNMEDEEVQEKFERLEQEILFLRPSKTILMFQGLICAQQVLEEAMLHNNTDFWNWIETASTANEPEIVGDEEHYYPPVTMSTPRPKLRRKTCSVM